MSQVIPLTQVSTLPNGEVVSRTVRPLTYALMWFVKNTLGMEDTIDIADDEMFSEWSVTIGDNEFPLYVNCFEMAGLYTLDIYFGEVSEDDFVTAIVTINELNCQIDAGNFQYINGGVRYHNSVIVKGIASEDPEYEGPHLISPKILENMFSCAKDLVANAVPHLQPFLRTQ